MHSSFYFSIFMKNFLFDGVNIDTTWGMVSTCLGLATLAIILEGLKICLQLYFQDNEAKKSCKMSEKTPLLIPHSDLLSQGQLSSTNRCQIMKKKRIMLRIFGAVHYMISIVVNYVLMLSVMSFNAYFIIAAVCGAGIGNLCFGFLITPTYPLSYYSIIDKHYNSNSINGDLNNEQDRIPRSGEESYGAIGETLRSDNSNKEEFFNSQVKNLMSPDYNTLNKSNKVTEVGNDSHHETLTPLLLKVEAEIHAVRGTDSL